MPFWTKLLGNKADDANEALKVIAFKWDPEAASDAEIEESVEQLEKDLRLRQEFKAELDREIREAEEAQEAFDAGVETLEFLQSEMEGAGKTKQAQLTKQAQAVAAELDDLEAALEREKADIAPAQERFDEINEIVEANQAQIQQAYQVRDRAITDMKAAERSKERAAEDRKRAERLEKARAGSGSSPVLSRLQQAATEAKDEAAVQREMTTRLKDARGGNKTSAIDAIQAARSDQAAKTADPFARLKK